MMYVRLIYVRFVCCYQRPPKNTLDVISGVLVSQKQTSSLNFTVIKLIKRKRSYREQRDTTSIIHFVVQKQESPSSPLDSNRSTRTMGLLTCLQSKSAVVVPTCETLEQWQQSQILSQNHTQQFRGYFERQRPRAAGAKCTDYAHKPSLSNKRRRSRYYRNR